MGMNEYNILFISIDSLRADAVSAIGADMNTTPFFDKFSKQSALFTSAFSNGIWTAPSHMSVFSGLYPTEHGIYNSNAISQGDVSLGDHPTLGQRLENNGYDTSAFYRLGWLSSGGIVRGFESDPQQNSKTGSGLISNIDGFLSNVPAIHTISRAVYRGSFRGHMPDEQIVDKAIESLQSVSEPFCRFVHLNDAHWPYSPVKPFYNQFTDRPFASLFWNRAYTQTRMFSSQNNDWHPSPTQIDVMKDLYLGAVRQVDHHLESLITAMPENVLDDTIVVIFGDHGEAFGEKGELGHNDIIPEVVHVPLLIRDPTGQLSNERIEETVQLSDIYQTIGTLTGISLPSTNTNDLTKGTLEGIAFSHAGQNEVNDSLLRKYGVWRSPSDYLIWDAEADTVEKYGNSEGLKSRLESHITNLDHVPPTGAKELDDDAKNQLRELGYLQ
jgi:arylsulfatase A-like enzyme